MFAFKYLFKAPYTLLKSANGRQLLKLMMQFGNVRRYNQRIITFLNYSLLVPDCMSFLFQFQEIFVEEFYKFYTTEKVPLIIDCGANIGMSCVYFKSMYPQSKVFAFEADSKIAAILAKNIQKNNLENVEIIKKAVWIDDQGIEFASEGSDGASIFGVGAKVKIDSIRLSEFLSNMPVIDMLKMDIEGAETAVIKDCASSLSRVKNIFIEYHSFPGQEQELNEILAILSKSNFRYYINSAQDRKSPLINHSYKDNTFMDVQLNIFAYKQ